MTSRQSISSILKPQKIRAPLKEIESVDQDADEDTATLPKKKVSFSGMNNIKMYITGASSLTVPTLFDDQISMMSDSSNGEKTKSSGKLEKSDGQMTFESTNCTNMEENGRVIIEYESPSMNMEITEAFSGKIFSDTIYTVDNNGSEHTDYSLRYSTNNMEFTEVVSMGQILTSDKFNSNSIEMSEIMNNEDEQSDNQLEHTNSLHDICAKNSSHLISQSSNIDIPHANIELHSTNLPKMTESSTMSSIPQKSFCLNNDHKSCSLLELPQLSDRQVFEDNRELTSEYCQQSLGIEPGTTSENEINENSNCEPEIVQGLCAKTSEIKNCLNNQNDSSGFENTNYNKDMVEKSSSSVVLMDIDSTNNDNESDSYVNIDTSKLVVHDKTNPIVPIILEIEDKECAAKHVQDNYSNIIEIINRSNIDVITPMVPTSSSFVQETSPEINLDKSVVVEKPLLQSTLIVHTSMFNESHSLEMDTSLEVKENHQKNYSRKTMIRPNPLIIHKEFSESEGMSDTFAVKHVNDEYSRNPFACTSEFFQTPSIENEDNSNNFSIVEENLQKKCSRKSIVPTSDFDKTLFEENEDYSDTSAAVEVSQQKVFSRKSIRLKSVIDENSFKENKDYLDLSASVKENQNICSTKSISPIRSLDFDQIQSPQKTNLSNISMSDAKVSHKKENTLIMVEKNQQKNYSRKSMGPTAILNSNNFSDDSLSNYSLITKDSNDLSLTSNNSKINNLDSSNHGEKMVLNSTHNSVLLNMIGDDDLNSPFKKKSRKTLSPIQSTNQPIYDSYDKSTNTSNNKENKPHDTLVENIEYSKMDVSVEIEHGDDLDIPITKLISNTLICENVNSSSSMNDSHKQSLKEKSLSFSKEPNVSATSCTLQESKEHKKNVQDGIYEIDDQKLVVTDEMEQHKIHLNKLTKDFTNLTESNNKRNIESLKHSMDTNNICIDLGIDDISNMSISDETHQKYEKSFLGSRKRSYGNRDGIPLSSSSFMYKCINDSTTENFNQEIILKESPIKKVSIKSLKTESSIENTINEEFVTKNLHSEVTEFLAKWSNLYFDESQLVIDTCNNNEWVFNILDSYIKLIIKYSPIISDHSYLKVEDILLTSQKTTENEIVKFGIYWILSKYSPKVYKQICSTSRDVEILLKSLLVDIQFIRLVMKNMALVRDVYCVTFKDNKAQFFLQSMNPLLMACIDVSLANIHKLSVKDINVDCLFGNFDVQVLDEIIENVTKDCNVLQSLVEKLKNFIRSIQIIAE